MPFTKSAYTSVPDQEPTVPTKPASDKPKEKYYRVRKITGFLYELLEVEIDESEVIPVRIGKQDIGELVLSKAQDYIYVHPDNRRKKKHASK